MSAARLRRRVGLGALALILAPATLAAAGSRDPSFSVSPDTPVAGEPVTLTAVTEGTKHAVTGLSWDLDGDGQYADAAGPVVQTTFAAPGAHRVRLRVDFDNGSHINVKRDLLIDPALPVAPAPPPAPPPAPSPPPTPPTPAAPAHPAAVATAPRPAKAPTLVPFPIVRMRGVIGPGGAHVQILSVLAPRGSTVRVLCHGKACPLRRASKLVLTRRHSYRVHAFERRFPAGVQLVVSVTAPGRVGKLTRFFIQAGRAPTRHDACADPIRHLQITCPA
jgi:hypothetical protein